MVALTKHVAVALSLAGSIATAMQVSPMKKKRSAKLELVMLDDSNVYRRGSHCLDGSTPGYYHSESSSGNGKWLFWFQGGATCLTEEDCASKLPLNSPNDDMEKLPIMETGEFSDYNHVYMRNCDFGLFAGDNPYPVEYNGTKLYFQGKRILDHVLDSLKVKTSFATATEVLMTGGSGGGQTSFTISDYLAGVLPTTVQKFGAAPINGWYADGSEDEMKSFFKLANMGNAVSTVCKNAFSEDDQYKCMIPAYSYTYAESPIFITQLFDYTYSKNETLSDLIGTQYMTCLYTVSSDCTQDDVGVLQNHLDSFTEQVQSTKQWQSNGGFLSTCTEHTFYNDEDMFAGYKNNGVSAGTAIETWWASLAHGSASASYYLPCTLGSSTNPQCEATCAA